MGFREMAGIRFKTLREEVASAIRMKILNGELEPGTRIVEQDMAAQLGVSRAPVREALRQNEEEGLIEYTRNVGCSVKQVSDVDLYEIYLLRATYEVLAVKLSQGRWEAETLRAMEDALGGMEDLEESDFHQAILYDNAFHAGIVRQVGLPRLMKAWDRLNSSNIITYYAGSQDHAAAVKRQYPIHNELYDMCRKGDVQEICVAIMDHYMLTTRRRMAEQGIDAEKFQFEVKIRL